MPSRKNNDLIKETQSKVKTLNPNELSKEELVLWFFHLRQTNESITRKIFSVSKELDQEKAANASLQCSLKQKGDLQELKKFESDALQNSITAANMRTILLDMGFPSTSVSWNVVFPLHVFMCSSLSLPYSKYVFLFVNRRFPIHPTPILSCNVVSTSSLPLPQKSSA